MTACSLRQLEASRSSVASVAGPGKPHLNPQVEWRPPLVDYQVNRPSTRAAQVNHFSASWQRKVSGQIWWRPPSCWQMLLLVIGNAQVNAHLGFTAGLFHFCFARHGLPRHFAAHLRPLAPPVAPFCVSLVRDLFIHALAGSNHRPFAVVRHGVVLRGGTGDPVALKRRKAA